MISGSKTQLPKTLISDKTGQSSVSLECAFCRFQRTRKSTFACITLSSSVARFHTSHCLHPWHVSMHHTVFIRGMFPCITLSSLAACLHASHCLHRWHVSNMMDTGVFKKIIELLSPPFCDTSSYSHCLH